MTKLRLKRVKGMPDATRLVDLGVRMRIWSVWLQTMNKVQRVGKSLKINK